MSKKTDSGDRKFVNGRRIVTEEIKQKIIRRYTDPVDPWGINPIINIYGFSRPTIKRILKEAGIELKTKRQDTGHIFR